MAISLFLTFYIADVDCPECTMDLVECYNHVAMTFQGRTLKVYINGFLGKTVFNIYGTVPAFGSLVLGQVHTIIYVFYPAPRVI